jgi:hypothetical protein
MDLPYSLHDEEGFLACEFIGEPDLDKLKAFANAIFAHIKDQGTRSILIDALRVETSPDNRDRFLYGEYIAQFFKNYRIALVIRKEFINRSFENVAWNRGVDINIFDNREEAMRWLIHTASIKITGANK